MLKHFFIYFIMKIITDSAEILENRTFVENTTGYMLNKSTDEDSRTLSILVIQSAIACIGIVSNLTVIVVFLNHKKLRRKIPNIFIINQVRAMSISVKEFCYYFLTIIETLGIQDSGTTQHFHCQARFVK